MSTTTSLAGITARFRSLLPMEEPVDVVGFRSTTPKYANSSDVLSGEGSRLHGGRWSPIGHRAVYASLSPEAAMAETLAYYRYYNLPKPPAARIKATSSISAIVTPSGGPCSP